MKTDQLVAMLASSAGPADASDVSRRWLAALGWGGIGAALLMTLLLGVRGDLGDAIALPMFWMKLAFPLSLAVAAGFAVERLARPGVRLGSVPVALAAPVLVLWLMAAAVLLQAAPDERSALIFGISWSECPANIALISLPVFIASLWTMKGLAPTRLALAGAAAGLLAGAVGAAVYAIHCTEMAAPFLGVWYVLGMLIPAAAGALAGPFLLRW